MAMKLLAPAVIAVTLLFTGCAVTTHDKCYVVKNESAESLSFKNLNSQEPLVDAEGSSRGLVDNILVSAGVNGIKNLIDNRKKRYTAEFNMSIRDLHFYNNLSTHSIFDPNGIIFSGFTLVRLLPHTDGSNPDTALLAHFVLDTARSYEIANSSIFRLKLDSFDYRVPKAKYRKSDAKMNLDFEITFTTSYVNETGDFFSNVVLGKFYYTVRNAPVQKTDPGYTDYYTRLHNTPLSGYCFIVPRSFGYYIDNYGQLKPSYSWGNYSISARIKESSKQSFVDKIITDNSESIINSTRSGLQKLAPAPTPPARGSGRSSY